MRTVSTRSHSAWGSWFERTYTVSCPNCSSFVDARDVWPCFMKKCAKPVCINCYIQHNEKAHPEIYRAKPAKKT